MGSIFRVVSPIQMARLVSENLKQPLMAFSMNSGSLSIAYPETLKIETIQSALDPEMHLVEIMNQFKVNHMVRRI